MSSLQGRRRRPPPPTCEFGLGWSNGTHLSNEAKRFTPRLHQIESLGRMSAAAPERESLPQMKATAAAPVPMLPFNIRPDHDPTSLSCDGGDDDRSGSAIGLASTVPGYRDQAGLFHTYGEHQLADNGGPPAPAEVSLGLALARPCFPPGSSLQASPLGSQPKMLPVCTPRRDAEPSHWLLRQPRNCAPTPRAVRRSDKDGGCEATSSASKRQRTGAEFPLTYTAAPKGRTKKGGARQTT